LADVLGFGAEVAVCNPFFYPFTLNIAHNCSASVNHGFHYLTFHSTCFL